MSKQNEMEDIFQSYEYLFREKLEVMDHMARNMFSEMSTFGIPKTVCDAYVQEKFKTLALEVIQKGGEQVVRAKRIRNRRTKH